MTTHAPSLLTDDGEPSVAFDILAAAGWTTGNDPAGNAQVVAPDGRARLVFQPESLDYAHTDALWKLEAVGFEVPKSDEPRAIPAQPTRWTATFTGEVPVALIAAFLARMVTPETIVEAASTAHAEPAPAGA